MIRTMSELAKRLDDMGLSKVSDDIDRLVRMSSRYDWPTQYQLDMDVPESKAEGRMSTPTQFWNETESLDPSTAPDANPHGLFSGPPEGSKFSTIPSIDDYVADDWWVPLPDAYSRMYQLLYTLREIDDMDRRASSGEYQEDPQNVELLRLKSIRPTLEREMETLVRHLAERSYDFVNKWVDAHMTTSHPLMGDAADDIMQDENTSPDEKIADFKSSILDALDLISQNIRIDPEWVARLLGVRLSMDRVERFNENPRSEIDRMMSDAGLGDDEDYTMDDLEYLSEILSDITSSRQFGIARRSELLESHPAFEEMENILDMFERAKSWQDLIIPIDIVRDIQHRKGKLMEDYGGFHPDYDYRKAFDAISGGEMEPGWRRQMRTMGSSPARWVRTS